MGVCWGIGAGGWLAPVLGSGVPPAGLGGGRSGEGVRRAPSVRGGWEGRGRGAGAQPSSSLAGLPKPGVWVWLPSRGVGGGWHRSRPAEGVSAAPVAGAERGLGGGSGQDRAGSGGRALAGWGRAGGGLPPRGGRLWGGGAGTAAPAAPIGAVAAAAAAAAAATAAAALGSGLGTPGGRQALGEAPAPRLLFFSGARGCGALGPGRWPGAPPFGSPVPRLAPEKALRQLSRPGSRPRAMKWGP